MPQLTGFRDGFGWQTPNATDILDKVQQVLDKTGKLRVNATLMVRELARLGTPVRLRTIERHPSHTRYHMVPDKIGGRDSEREVTLDDLKEVMPQLLSGLDAQAYELLQLNPDDPVLTLFLRSSVHHPLGLHTLLTRPEYAESSSHTLLAMGLDFGQNLILRDLTDLGNILIIGGAAARLHLQIGFVLTLMLFNSPSSLRVALVGDETSSLRHLAGSPHVLGSIIPDSTGFRRLLDGMGKYIKQRKQSFLRESVENLDEYNHRAISDKSLNPLPRIVVLVDTVGVSDWRSQTDKWLVPLHQIVSKGSEVGIHCIMTAQDMDTLPDRIADLFSEQIVMRSAMTPSELANRLPFQFVDAVMERRDDPAGLVALETAAISEVEMVSAVTYWKNMKSRRDEENKRDGQSAEGVGADVLALKESVLPRSTSLPGDDESFPLPIIADNVIASAQALAAYLGWLGMGPLLDVLSLSSGEAEETLRILEALGILEPGEGPIWRFVRLVEAPEPKPPVA